MLSARRRSLRLSTTVRALSLISAVALLAGCTSAVAGSPQPAAVVGASAVTTSAGGQITEPSALPGGSATATPTTRPGTPAPAAPTTTTPAATAPTTGTSAGVVPKGLEKFYGQKLAWQACANYATSADTAKLYQSTNIQCARLTVPLAYDAPAGQTVQIGLLRKVATDSSARIGSLVTDPGGPGGSGMGWLASYVVNSGQVSATPDPATTVIKDLNQKFDLVGIDPRGIGSSLPAIQCQTDAEKDATRATDPRSRNQAEVDAANAITKTIVEECVANTGKAQGIDGKTFLANVGTRDVARDLDVLRAALGDPKLSYMGFSYGTEIGWEYAEQFPANVRAILFDGDVSPIEDPATESLGQQKGFQNAFADFASWCATNSPGCALGTNPTKALANFQALVRPLLTQHLALTDGRTLSFGDAVTATSFGLYFNQLRTALAKGLANLEQGSGDLLMAIADQYDDRDSTGHYSNEQDAFNAVRCVDGPRMSDPAEVTKFNTAYAAAGPYAATGDPAGAIVDICADWPVPPTLLPHRLHITGLPKTLVISTTGDPATPYANGVELAKEIGGQLLTVNAVRHTSYLTDGDTCVDKLGTAYLESLTLPAAGATCN